MNEKEIQALLDAILEEYSKKLSDDQHVRKCLKLIAEGTATHEDAYDYALSAAAALSKALERNLNEEMFTAGQLDYETLRQLLLPSYKKAHDTVNEYCIEVQRALNEKAGIGLKPAEAAFRSRRVVGLASRASQEEFFVDVRRDIMGPYLENFCQNTVDESIKNNVDLHGEAGLRPTVVRLATGNCCKWCLALEGEYLYPNVPEDVYHRHRNCRCTVAYDPGTGAKKNVWTKKYFSEDITAEIERRRSLLEKKPKVENVTTDYLRSAKPGKGSYIPYEGIDEVANAKEIKCAKWLVDTFGGDVEMIEEAPNVGRRCDYRWNFTGEKEFWEEKGVSSVRSIDDRIHSAMGQIYGDKCGIIIDIARKKADTETMVEEIKYRLPKRSKYPVVDVIIKDGDSLVGIYRYKK